MDLKIVKFIQSGANEFLDFLFSILTRFGEEIFFVSMFLILYWAVGKVYAFKFSFFYVLSYLVNSVLKAIVDRPRPWHASDEVVNKLQASGSSFPSGHSQSISAISTYVVYDIYSNKSISKRTKNWSLVVAILLCLTVAFTRMYLGQHYLTDVLAGLTIGAVLIVGLKFVANKISPKIKSMFRCETVLALLGITVLLVIAILSVKDFGLSAKLINKVFRYGGMLVGYAFGYICSELTYTEANISIWSKLIKIAIGFVVVFGLYILLSLVSTHLLYRFVVYVICSVVATFVYPYVFNLVYKKIVKE